MVQKFRNLVPGFALLLAMAACQQNSADDADRGAAPPAADAVAAGTPADAAHDAEADESHDAQTLRVIMQGLSVEMQAFSHALFIDDTVQMVARAGAIADHAHLLPSEVERIKGVLGTEMPAFEAADERVHLGAERLHDIAKTGKLDEVVRQFGEVQRDCVACHTQFRERLRTDRP